MTTTTKRFRAHAICGIAAGALALCLTSSTALANETSEREAQLEQRLLELEAQVERLTAKSQVGASSELVSRIAELERVLSAGDTGMSTYWKGGLRADSADGDFKFKIGGRTQLDFVRGDVDNAIERFMGAQDTPPVTQEKFDTGAYFRRARLFMAGTIYGNVGFKAEYDFAGGDADFTDVYMTLDHPCIGFFTVGHHYEPIGMTNLTSDNLITFMERGMDVDLLPDRSTGISLRNTFDGNWNWAIGSFRDSDSYGDDRGNTSQGEWNHTARVAGVAWENPDDDNHLVHLGVGGSLRNPSDESITFGTHGNQRLSSGSFSTIGATGTPRGPTPGVESDDGTLYNVEAAYVNGPFFMDTEFARANFDVDGGPSDATVEAWHATFGYYVTGESRVYDRKNNVWGRTAPKKNYGDGGGTGAVQVALRYDEWNPSGGAGAAPDIDQWTVGVAWYLNPHTRVLLNVTKGQVDDLGDYDLLGMRFAIDF